MHRSDYHISVDAIRYAGQLKMSILAILLAIITLSATLERNQNNVCSTIEAYFDNIEDFSKYCWFDKDVNASVEKLVINHGLKLEKHNVKTNDEYILTMFRLKTISGPYGKEVIFLQHALGTDAESYMVNGNKSIAFVLAKQGFDVWLGNFRGTEFSRHESLSRHDPKFWDFSFHEHGLYDLSASFKYIASKTNRKIIYIAHSMGGTAMGIYASMKPKEAETYVKHAILMGATFYMRSLKGILTYDFVNSVYTLLPYVTSMNLNVIAETDSFERQLLQKVCFSSLETARTCLSILTRGAGKFPKSTAMDKLPRAIKAFKNIGFKNLHHYAQMILTGDFRMFDYGTERNELKYNSSIPPIYDLSRIIIPISLIYFNNDVIATKKDTTYAFTKYGKDNWDLSGWPFNHLSFLIDNKVDKTFYPFLLKIINKYINM